MLAFWRLQCAHLCAEVTISGVFRETPYIFLIFCSNYLRMARVLNKFKYTHTQTQTIYYTFVFIYVCVYVCIYRVFDMRTKILFLFLVLETIFCFGVVSFRSLG